MAERRLDLVSLTTGLLALIFSGLVLLDRAGASIDGAAAAAAVVVAAGLAGLVLAVARLRSAGGAPDAPPAQGTGEP